MRILVGLAGDVRKIDEIETYVLLYPVIVPTMGIAANGAGKRGTLVVENEDQLIAWAADRFTQYEIRG